MVGDVRPVLHVVRMYVTYCFVPHNSIRMAVAHFGLLRTIAISGARLAFARATRPDKDQIRGSVWWRGTPRTPPKTRAVDLVASPSWPFL